MSCLFVVIADRIDTVSVKMTTASIGLLGISFGNRIWSCVVQCCVVGIVGMLDYWESFLMCLQLLQNCPCQWMFVRLQCH